MRGSNKQSSQTTSKRKKFAEESDESSDSEPSTQQPITQSTSQSASNVSRFLVVQSQGEKSRCQRDSNIHVRRNGVLKRTNTYVLTFNTPILPKKIKAVYIYIYL